jgi:tetratricopeptide (TPR) repeat protein
VALLSDGVAEAERAAALNNLGLAQSDLGDHAGAVQALRQAVAGLAAAPDPDVAPQRVMAHHNLGQVLAAAGDHAAAIDTYLSVLAEVDEQRLPFQWALLHHATGVSQTAVAQPAEAVGSFGRALQVFTRSRHPFQHALAKHNLGLAWAQVGGTTGLRQAVVAFGDALAVLDSRVHRPLWQQAYRNLQAVQAALAAEGYEASRAEHLAALLAELDEAARTDLLREQLTRLLALPDPRRGEALAELELAALGLPQDDAIAVTVTRLAVLLELPDPQLRVGLQAMLAARSGLDEAALDDAEQVLDQAISGGMLAPQRIRVRDHLTALGWERR